MVADAECCRARAACEEGFGSISTRTLRVPYKNDLSLFAGSKHMNKHDFSKIIGVENADAEYLPVACMLRSGYGCAGYYNAELNRDLQNTCVLVNARLVAFDNTEGNGRQATIQ